MSNGRLERKPLMSGDLVDTLRDVAESAYQRYLPADRVVEGELLADRICDNCGDLQSSHIAGRFCQPSKLDRKKTSLLEFRPRQTERVCPTCNGEGQVGRPFDGDSDPCGDCKGKGRL